MFPLITATSSRVLSQAVTHLQEPHIPGLTLPPTWGAGPAPRKCPLGESALQSMLHAPRARGIYQRCSHAPHWPMAVSPPPPTVRQAGLGWWQRPCWAPQWSPSSQTAALGAASFLASPHSGFPTELHPATWLHQYSGCYLAGPPSVRFLFTSNCCVHR